MEYNTRIFFSIVSIEWKGELIHGPLTVLLFKFEVPRENEVTWDTTPHVRQRHFPSGSLKIPTRYEAVLSIKK